MLQDIEKICRLIKYNFKNKDLLLQALTHRSKNKKHNERLEFLGDAVLSMVIAERLYIQFPYENEGNLSLLRMYLVQGKTLTDMANKFHLGENMSFGVGEIKSGGHKRARILEDAFEALIGAIYLDSDYSTAKECILSWYDDKLKILNVDEHTKDSKTKLQEILQGQIQMKPNYKVISIEGEDHNQTFHVEVSLASMNKSFQATGKSRKSAEHEAARIALMNILPKKNV